MCHFAAKRCFPCFLLVAGSSSCSFLIKRTLSRQVPDAFPDGQLWDTACVGASDCLSVCSPRRREQCGWNEISQRHERIAASAGERKQSVQEEDQEFQLRQGFAFLNSRQQRRVRQLFSLQLSLSSSLFDELDSSCIHVPLRLAHIFFLHGCYSLH